MGTDSLQPYTGGGDPTPFDDRILKRWPDGDPVAIRFATRRFLPEYDEAKVERVVRRVVAALAEERRAS